MCCIYGRRDGLPFLLGALPAPMGAENFDQLHCVSGVPGRPCPTFWYFGFVALIVLWISLLSFAEVCEARVMGHAVEEEAAARGPVVVAVGRATLRPRPTY